MTEHKHLKALIRSRMTRTGESYSIARMHLTHSEVSLALTTTIDAHDGHCMVVRFVSGDGLLLSGGFGGQLHLWSTSDWSRQGGLTGHTSSVNGVAIDPSGRLAVSVSSDKTVRVWDITAQSLLRVLGRHSKTVAAVDVSADAALAVSVGHDKRLRMWRIEDGSDFGTILLRDRPGAVALHPHQPWVAVGAVGPRLGVYALDGEPVVDLPAPGEASTAVRWSHDGEILVASGVEGRLSIWATRDWAPVREVSLPGGGWVPVAVGAGGRLIAAGWDHHVGVWEASRAEPVVVLDGLPKGVYSLDFSHDGSFLVVAAADGRARVWSIR